MTSREQKLELAERERILRDAWSSRQLERLSEGYDIQGIIASERVVA
jgi:hypothetical protein